MCVEKVNKIMDKTNHCIPISIFKETRLTPFELIVWHLKDTKQLSYAEIGRLLNRDERNIWTVYQRAKKKVE
jgi:predicted DNA-binding protein (UPF0251 family)